MNPDRFNPDKRSVLEHQLGAYRKVANGLFNLLRIEVRNESDNTLTSTSEITISPDIPLPEAIKEHKLFTERWRELGRIQTFAILTADDMPPMIAEVEAKLANF